ncbi:DUF5806 family protein [Halanaeroarchaeum sulfurireducens]|uniref:Uncharacterized protein n=1 Tax=Halanaeroarchaeum sulfurireducens TaxID=1604004 RepID=A0A0N9MUL5_9EURY|nr:DUF5806 family protein [Halanaeroarchaeum sulfurireducens]ALG81171.1 hypothetical protein HLASA_0260 [Halanaeroarchaeum sulfurireducens]
MPADERPSDSSSDPDDEPADRPETASETSADGEGPTEFTDTGHQPVGEPPAGRPEVDVDADPDSADDPSSSIDQSTDASDVPPDVRTYDPFKKVDGAQYERVNDFLRDRTYITAREWAIARLCSDFRTETGVEMTKIGENLPHLVPFMTDTYTPQAVNQARSSFEEKVRKAGATFLYGAMSDFFTADELDELMYEVTEIAKFLLEVEGVDLAVEEELDSEERISSVMREVREASDELRHEGTTCPECGHEIGGADDETHAEE